MYKGIIQTFLLLGLLLNYGELIAYPHIKYSTPIVGKDVTSKQYINAKLYEFSFPIDNYLYDTASADHVQFRLKSERTIHPSWYFINVSKTSNSILNFQDLNKAKPYVFSNREKSFINTGSESHVIEHSTGKLIQKYPQEYTYVDPCQTIGLYFRGSGGGTLRAVDLHTGQKKWKTQFDSYYGWESALLLDDDILIIESEGIYGIRLSDGRNWNYKAKTTDSDPPITELNARYGTGLKSARNFGFGHLTNEAVISGISSNVLEDNDTLFFAHRDTLVCLGKYGQRIWQTTTNYMTMSRSILFSDSANVYIINLGYAYEWMWKVPYGNTFIAGYNKRSGERIFYNQPAINNGAILNGYVNNNRLIIQTSSAIIQYELSTGTYLNEIRCNYDKDGVFLLNPLNYTYKVQEDSTVVAIDKATLIETSKQQSFIYKADGTFTKVDYSFDYFTLAGTYEDKTVLTNMNRTVVLNSDYRIIWDIKLPRQASVINDEITCIDNNRIYFIPLKE